MKMYYFSANYEDSQEAWVLAESLEKAKEYLLNTKTTRLDKDYIKYHRELINDMISSNGYSVNEYNLGEVAFKYLP